MITESQFAGPWEVLLWCPADPRFRSLFPDGSELSVTAEGAFFTLAWRDPNDPANQLRSISGLTAEGLVPTAQEARLGVVTEIDKYPCTVTLAIRTGRPLVLKGTVALADGFGDGPAGTFIAEADPPEEEV
jgi:hypothetical protein